MTNIFISLMFCVFAFISFQTSFKCGGLNRSLIYLPIEIIKNNVVISDYNSRQILYFNQDDFIMDCDAYFDKISAKYALNLDITYSFYEEDGEALCLDGYCQSVKISLSSNIGFNYIYNKSMLYRIGESYG